MESETIDLHRRILGTMRRALLFSLGMVCSSNAFFGDWKIWTPVQTARSAVLRADQTVLAATTGGVVEWNPATAKGTVLTGLQDLPSLDIASVVADSSGNIWAICTDGHLAVLVAGSSFWEPVGSYTTSGWTFSPGVATFWKGYLVLGGPKGLSLFSTTDRVAVDNISSFGTVRDTVTSVMAQHDTLWVSLPQGLAYATDPVWNTDSASKHIGKAGYYLSADRWTVQSALSRGAYTLLRDSTGVHLGTLGQWSDFANGLQISGGKFSWKGGSASVPGVFQAISTPWGHFLSTTGNGLQLLTSDGKLQTLHPEGALPDNLPFSVAMGKDGTLLHLTGDGSSTRLWRRGQSGNWVVDTIQVPSQDNPSIKIRPTWPLSYDLSSQQRVLASGPKGEAVVASWGDATSHGGFLVSSAPGTWTQWNHNNDTCFQNPIDQAYGTIGLSVRTAATGVWASTYTYSSGPIFFFPSEGNKTPTCMEIDATKIGVTDQVLTVDLLPVGSDLWLATTVGLIRVANATPSNPPQIPSGLTRWPQTSYMTRVVEYPFQGKTWIVAAGNGVLGAIASDAVASDTFIAASGITQLYTGLVVDAQGQIWAAGNQGIDIFSLQGDSSGRPKFVRARPQPITQNDGLPDNNIRDLALDSATGKALIASASGLSLWTSPYRSVPSRLTKSIIKVYPNPVRLRQNRTLFVDGATSGAQFDLVAADGTLILHQDRDKSNYGAFQINLPTTSKVRPGVYYWSLKDSRNSVHGPLLIGE